MAITVLQIPSALLTVSSLQEELSNLMVLLNQAKNLSDNSWLINIGTTSPINITVPISERNSLVAQYDSIKAQLVTTFQQLP